MLTKELRDKWATALRSGQYVQGRKALRTGYYGTDEVRHCCLGVLCEVAGIERNGNRYHVPNSYTGKLPDRDDWSSVETPTEIAGLGEEECKNFVKLNDFEGRDFDRIAEEVEKLPAIDNDTGLPQATVDYMAELRRIAGHD